MRGGQQLSWPHLAGNILWIVEDLQDGRRTTRGTGSLTAGPFYLYHLSYIWNSEVLDDS